MTSTTISNIAFAGVFLAIGLAVFGKVTNKTAIIMAGGFLAVGFATKPGDTTA